MINLELTTDEIAVARSILRYLFARPRARDSVKTIAERWIRRQRLEEAVTTVRHVIAVLVQDGLLLEFDDPPGFGVNRQRLDDISDYIGTSDR